MTENTRTKIIALLLEDHRAEDGMVEECTIGSRMCYCDKVWENGVARAVPTSIVSEPMVIHFKPEPA